MSLMRAQFQRYLFGMIKELVDIGRNEIPLLYPQLYRVVNSDSAFEEVRTMAGLGLYVERPEGTEAHKDQMVDGFPKRFNHIEHALGVGWSHRFMKDIKMQMLKDRSLELGRSNRSTEDELNADMLELAFDATNQPIPDTKALCATDHPNVREGTQSNIISPVGTVSVSTVRSMLTKARRFKDDTGVRRIRIMLEKLVVPPEEEFNAAEILKSAGRPDTANRADNVTRGALTEFVYPYLDDTNNFFGLARKDQLYLFVFIRERFNLREYEDEKTRIMWTEGSFIQSHGPAHWLGVIGSNPAPN